MRPIDADALIEFCAERWIPLNIDAVNMQPTIQPEKAQLSQEGATSDLISRKAAIDLFPNDALEWDTLNGYIAPHVARRLIEQLPPVQPETQEGHWIGKYPTTHICSECGWLIPDSKVKVFAYCPNCGADMRGEQDG